MNDSFLLGPDARGDERRTVPGRGAGLDPGRGVAAGAAGDEVANASPAAAV